MAAARCGSNIFVKYNVFDAARTTIRRFQGLRTTFTHAGCIASAPVPEFENNPKLKTYDDLYRFSLEEPDLFWGSIGRSRLQWFRDFDKVHDCDLGEGKISWFVNGKINVSVNCVDRHSERNPDRVALIWEKDEPGQEEYVTYRELLKQVCQFANMLKEHGVKTGDRVAIYLPNSPMAIVAMLACTRIGAVHNVVFAGFSAKALSDRINDAQAETVITTDQAVRGGKIIELKKTVDTAVASSPCVRQVFVARRTGNDVPMSSIDIPLEKTMEQCSKSCDPAILNSEDLLFMLYTSGSTGAPKGIVHTQAGYLTYVTLTHQMVFDYTPGDIYACVADIGWITGHSYVCYGPLSNGATTVLFESIPTYPDPGRYWEMVERLKVNQIYVAPTAVRLLLKSGDDYVYKYDRSTLKTLGCVGEPLNHEAWEWYNYVIGEGNCDLVDTWWQTETGGICISPRPSAPGAEIKPAMPMRPFLGIDPVLVEPESGKELEGNDVYGALCMRRPWPGMCRTIWGDHERFKRTYFDVYKDFYFSGDGARRSDEGHYQITGRMDDVINVSGHRLGTAEIEDAMDEHPAIAETAVIGCPHEIKGESVYAYVVLKDNVFEHEDQIIEELCHLVKTKIASYAVPQVINVTNGLPKTRSGKIMRRILRNVAQGKSDQLGDITTLADPGVVEQLVKNHDKLTKGCSQ